jgi:hypothetical protein
VGFFTVLSQQQEVVVKDNKNSMGWTNRELRLATLQILSAESKKSSSGIPAKAVADALVLSDRILELENVLLEHHASSFVDVADDGYRITEKGLKYLVEQLDINQ